VSFDGVRQLRNKGIRLTYLLLLFQHNMMFGEVFMVHVVISLFKVTYIFTLYTVLATVTQRYDV